MENDGMISKEDIMAVLNAHGITLSDDAVEEIGKDIATLSNVDAEDRPAFIECMVGGIVYNEAVSIVLTDTNEEVYDMRDDENADYEELDRLEDEVDSFFDCWALIDDIREAVRDLAETGFGSFENEGIYISREDDGVYSVTEISDDGMKDRYDSAGEAINAFIEEIKDVIVSFDDVDLSDVLGDGIDGQISDVSHDLSELTGTDRKIETGIEAETDDMETDENDDSDWDFDSSDWGDGD